MQDQFRRFSRFGDRHSDGRSITLSRCDKWLRQAEVIRGGGEGGGGVVTTADTAILFRRMSRCGRLGFFVLRSVLSNIFLKVVQYYLNPPFENSKS